MYTIPTSKVWQKNPLQKGLDKKKEIKNIFQNCSKLNSQLVKICLLSQSFTKLFFQKKIFASPDPSH
jgi:hypothetical protein